MTYFQRILKMQTWSVTEYGFRIYVDGNLVATITRDEYMILIAELSGSLVSRQLPLVKNAH